MNTLKGVALVYFLIEKICEKYPDVQIGKTVVQKMAYLFGRERGYDFKFSMYHYGPYSALISHYLDLAEALEFLKITWNPESGYFIEPNLDKTSEDYQTLLQNIDKKDQEKINEVVENYGKLKPLAIKLSIISTALYIKENFGVHEKEEIIKIIKVLKPQISHLVEETINEMNI